VFSSYIFITVYFNLKTKLGKLREIVARDGGKAKAKQTYNNEDTTHVQERLYLVRVFDLCVFDSPFGNNSTCFIGTV